MLANIGHACPNWHAALTAAPFSFICSARPASLYCEQHIWLRRDCIWITVATKQHCSETYLHKSGAVRSVNWIFIIGAPAWRWLGEYVTLDRTFYSLLLQQDAVAGTVTATLSSLSHSSRRPLLGINILWINCGPGSSIESRWGRDFPPVQTGPGAHPASCKMGTGSFPGLKCGRGVLLTTHSLLVPRSWKSRAIPLPGPHRACNGNTLTYYELIITYNYNML